MSLPEPRHIVIHAPMIARYSQLTSLCIPFLLFFFIYTGEYRIRNAMLVFIKPPFIFVLQYIRGVYNLIEKRNWLYKVYKNI